MRIAICDDNQLEVDLFKERVSGFLRRKGDYRYEINEYSAGYPLVEDVKEGKWYDVIVLDMILENENGLEIANRLRDIGYSFYVSSTKILFSWTIFKKTYFNSILAKFIKAFTIFFRNHASSASPKYFLYNL